MTMKALTLSEFLDKTPENFSNKYLALGLFRRGQRAMVKALCRNHGVFEIYTGHVYAGSGCKRCGVDKRVQSASDSFESVVHKARQVHGDTYEYLKLGKLSGRPSIYFLCKEHGEVHKTTNKHISAKQGCPQCSNLESSQNKRYSFEDYKTKALKVHGEIYDYKELSVEGGFTYVNYECKQHGAVRQLAASHLRGSGCNACGYVRSGELLRHTLESFKQAADSVHGNRYEYLDLGINQRNRSTIRYLCKKHGEHTQTTSDHLIGQGCPKCSTRVSKGELELLTYIHTLYPTAVGSYKYQGRKEADIFMPELKLAIEYDGLPWHSTMYKTRAEQALKTKELKALGISLVRIFEDEWYGRNKQVKNILEVKLGNAKPKICASQCSLVKIADERAREFYGKYCLQSWAGKGLNLGLVRNNTLVALMTFTGMFSSRRNTKSSTVKLAGYASAVQVAGGGDRLLQALVDKIKPLKVIAYSDNRFSTAATYTQLGFREVEQIAPNYTYWKEGTVIRQHKSKFQHKHLPKLLAKYDPQLTEKQNCENNGYYQIYDDGLTKWELTV